MRQSDIADKTKSSAVTEPPFEDMQTAQVHSAGAMSRRIISVRPASTLAMPADKSPTPQFFAYSFAPVEPALFTIIDI